MSDQIRGCDKAAERMQEQLRLLSGIVNVDVFNRLQQYYTDHKQDGLAVFQSGEYFLLIWQTGPQRYPEERRDINGYSLDVWDGEGIGKSSPEEFIELYTKPNGKVYGSIDRIRHEDSMVVVLVDLISKI